MKRHPLFRREVTFAAVILLVTAAWVTSAHAQFGSGCGVPGAPCDTYDGGNAPGFDAFYDIDTVQLPAILQQDSTTAESVTATGGGGTWQPSTQTIASLDQILFAGITSQSFGPAALLTGWKPCKPDCTTPAQNIVTTLLQTYQSALQVAQQQAQALEAQNFTSIANDSAGETNLLPLVRDVVDSNLQMLNELQTLIQAVDTLVVVEASAHANEINNIAVRNANTVGTADPSLNQ